MKTLIESRDGHPFKFRLKNSMKPYTGIWVYKRGWTAYIIKVSGNRKKPWYKVLKTIDLWNTSPHDFEWYCKSLEYIRKHDLYFRGEIHE